MISKNNLLIYEPIVKRIIKKKKNDGNAATETCVKINFKNMFLLLFYPK